MTTDAALNLFEQSCGTCLSWLRATGYPTKDRVCSEKQCGWYGHPKHSFEGIGCKFHKGIKIEE